MTNARAPGSRSDTNVVVTGDTSVDWFHVSRPPSDRAEDDGGWRLIEGSVWSAVEGGASLLAAMIQAKLSNKGCNLRMRRPSWDKVLKAEGKSLAKIPSSCLLHSYAMLRRHPQSLITLDRAEVLRVHSYSGYAGPKSGLPRPLPLARPRAHKTEPLSIFHPESRNVLVIDDAGGGYRQDRCAWEPILVQAAHLMGPARPILVSKMNRPLARGALWDAIQAGWRDQTVVIVTAEALRSHGLDLSRRLSWDRTLVDFWTLLSETGANVLSQLAQCRHLIVVFGTEAAIWCFNQSTGKDQPHREIRLVFDPVRAEGDFVDECSGRMPGMTTAFTATLAAALATPTSEDNQESCNALISAIREGLRRARLLMLHGFRMIRDAETEIGAVRFPIEEVFSVDLSESSTTPPTWLNVNAKKWRDEITAFLDYRPTGSIGAHLIQKPGFSILSSVLNSNEGLDASKPVYWAARTFVLEERFGAAVPFARMGDLLTADRWEIESYRSVANLLSQYRRRVLVESARRAQVPKPISFAVFGPPGSGKSFGVIELAKQIFRADLKQITFNLSQFGSPSELASAFHQIRDVYLSGGVPFVLFDEFDSKLDSEMDWLKYFLAPMQDGKFRDGSHEHPIGAAVFVFAGGTAASIEEFESWDPEAGRGLRRRSSGEDYSKAFKGQKGPDFVSRLRGYVNVKGINPADDDDPSNPSDFWMIRRAILLRAFLTRQAPGIFRRQSGRMKPDIDESVLRALLTVKSYNHGVRSLTALIEMSSLVGRNRFSESDLPSDDYLKLHASTDFAGRLRDANGDNPLC